MTLLIEIHLYKNDLMSILAARQCTSHPYVLDNTIEESIKFERIIQLLEELIPGLKLGGMELNPFKRISKDALGGNMLLGAGAGLAAAGMSGLTNGIQRAGQTIGNVKRAEGARGKLGAAVSGLGRTAGSTITGATRGGLNAFGRTSKDGKIFSGAWNGYQTSMFSKKLREDNLRKAGLEGANVLERAKFGIGSMTSDLARYADEDGLFVNNMATMIQFYRDVLGFEIKEDENTDNVYLLKDGTLFLLYGRKDFEKLTSKRYEYLTGVNAHSEMALYVDTYEEVDKQYKNAIDHGATSLLEPTTEPWGQRTCFIADPEGNIIEIGSWNKPYEEKDL